MIKKTDQKTSPIDEALYLAEETLKNIELSEIPLSNIALKMARLCRLLNLEKYRKIFEYEVSGYPSSPTGVPKEIWDLGTLAGRVYEEKEKDEIKSYMYMASIDSLDQEIVSAKEALKVSQDPSNSNLSQQSFVVANWRHREKLLSKIRVSQNRLSERKSFIYRFCLEKYYELKFSDQVESLFNKTRMIVDKNISKIHPEGLHKLTSILNNLKSDNIEDWSNAAHSCRRLLQEIADQIYPPSSEDKILESGKRIKIGKENYINRLVCFVEENGDSKTHSDVIAAELRQTGERLDALFNAAQKGSHNSIKSKHEAERYIIYTYLLIGEILDLKKKIKIEKDNNIQSNELVAEKQK